MPESVSKNDSDLFDFSHYELGTCCRDAKKEIELFAFLRLKMVIANAPTSWSCDYIGRGLSIPEIAARLGMSTQSAHRRIKRLTERG